jgi:hypothetical protein
LRKAGFDFAYLDDLDFQEILIIYFNECEACLADNSIEWTRNELRDIESEANKKDMPTGNPKEPYRERTPEEKEIYLKELCSKKFSNKKEK